MIGIIVQLLLSWLIIWLFNKSNLNVLGLTPDSRRISDFFLFFLLTSVCCASGFLMRMYWGHESWKLNPEISFRMILTGIWWNIKAVLFEELIFRGVLLYILIKKLGALKAILISAAAFGIYHWFSFEVLGQPLPMLTTFLITGTMGLVLAYAFYKTNSLYIPIAIHLGWNMTQIFIFSSGPIGQQLLIPAKPQPIVTVSYFIFYCISFFPLVSALLANYLILKSRKLNV